MSTIKNNVITNANVYLDGVGLLGQVMEVNMPEIKFKKAEFKALGMVGSADFTAGIEKLSNKIKWTSFYADTLKKVANPFRSLSFQIRGDLQNWESQNVTGNEAVVCYLRGTTTNFPGFAMKQQDNVEGESEFSITYYKLEINDEPIIEIDVLANIFKVDGDDLLTAYRANTGT
jgi:P2 family phage contractile tail tube protein